jgi:hypothetical protein
MAMEIILGEPGLRHPGPYTTMEQGWIVVLAITNLGLTPVRGEDFTAPLAFAFPGRQIHATQLSSEPAARAATMPPHLPAAHVPAGNDREPGPARLQLTGDFLLRPRGSYLAMLILSGTPADDSPHIQQEGSLARGKIILSPDAQQLRWATA